MSPKVLLLIGGLVIATILSAIAVNSSSEAHEGAYRQVVARKEPLAVTILSTGVVQPENRVGVESPISGRAEKVLVENGDHVQKGQILLWMSSIERAALLDAARTVGPDEVKQWEDFYQPMSIVAPITGTVIVRNVEPGQTFTYSDKLFIIADRLVVQAQVDETDIAQIKKRQSAKIVLDAYPDQPITGHVEEIAYEAKTVNNVTSYGVIVLPNHVPDFMRSGMTANISFAIESKESTLVIPTEAVRVKDDRLYVLLQGPNGSEPPIERPIKTGLSDGKRIEVLQGLNEGDVALIPKPELSGETSQAATTNPLDPTSSAHN